ncbi:MAG: hypothetical protein IPH36_14180 [Saprospiraceae bacterium]|nr:hypothetical protein [Saprospiraceae bacterium]
MNGIKLDAESNLESLFTLEEVFVQRSYADYFPFYKKATIVDIGAHKGYFHCLPTTMYFKALPL